MKRPRPIQKVWVSSPDVFETTALFSWNNRMIISLKAKLLVLSYPIYEKKTIVYFVLFYFKFKKYEIFRFVISVGRGKEGKCPS